MSASSTTFIPISGSTTARRASRIASSVARRSGSKAARRRSPSSRVAMGIWVVLSVMLVSGCVP